ncbi:uncharacterized protein BP01DRAFT_351979 [Aspergillus saccharolyticus JOP 1030-1]|uniref:Uncharacterized protein n=1 Tax=Aspergillus saccharolyticus JOP 1030-1 TaxID=1450539 RepID=A0A318Z1F6_9EURO|nr:hypothetical protein BP01DRAFT_351979 [Aspergillus saccharolyticus JOP 1030-1]PYH40117.1 hypothetical protein BP01DRAFT_351979 [Aspergillus saccharolyticus JOP 1030-1]
MAHQAHNIPWSLLASNLHWSTFLHKGHFVTNLRPRMKPSQDKELTCFTQAFIQNIDDHSLCERRNYPAEFDPPASTEVILVSVIVHQITSTVRRWRSYGFRGEYPSGVCKVNQHEQDCQCKPLPVEERTASAFLRPPGSRQCDAFFRANREASFNIEVVKTLLLYSEMNPILRVCALPGVRLKGWWHDGECQCAVLGWDQVCIKALRAGICLNTIRCFPALWNNAAGRTKKQDYRNSKFYQFTLRTCTGAGNISDVSTYPHRQFSESATTNFKALTIDELLTLESVRLEGQHQPGQSDTLLVRNLLYRKGLPVELVLEVMEITGYGPLGRLSEPEDPIHPSNRDELARYLTYCWRLLVHCDMMAKALGMKLPWKELLGNCIVDLWVDEVYGKGGGGGFYWARRDVSYNGLPKVFIKPESSVEI